MTATSLTRRSALRGAALSTVAAAIPATVATAIGATPALVEAAGADPIFALIAERDRVKALSTAACERLKGIREAWPALCRAPDDANAKTVWRAAYDAAADRSGYSRLEKEEQAIYERALDLTDEIALTPALTLAGAMARLGVVVASIRAAHFHADGSIDEDETQPEHIGILGVFEDLKRLLPGSAVAS
jgi:hypothetical protein